MTQWLCESESKAPVSQLVNAEVNCGNRKAVLASNQATRIRGRHAALRECIMWKVIYLTCKTIKLHTHSDSFRYWKQRKHGGVSSFGGFTWLPIDKKKNHPVWKISVLKGKLPLSFSYWKQLADNTPTTCFLLRISFLLSWFYVLVFCPIMVADGEYMHYR